MRRGPVSRRTLNPAPTEEETSLNLPTALTASSLARVRIAAIEKRASADGSIDQNIASVRNAG